MINSDTKVGEVTFQNHDAFFGTNFVWDILFYPPDTLRAISRAGVSITFATLYKPHITIVSFKHTGGISREKFESLLVLEAL